MFYQFLNKLVNSFNHYSKKKPSKVEQNWMFSYVILKTNKTFSFSHLSQNVDTRSYHLKIVSWVQDTRKCLNIGVYLSESASKYERDNVAL